MGLSDGTGRTFLAVDRFAIRTLCYRVIDGQLHFAARADELADAASEIDPQAIFDYLYFHVIPSPRTIFKGVYRLPPGHCALFENGSSPSPPTGCRVSKERVHPLRSAARPVPPDRARLRRQPFEQASPPAT